jgi:phenylalanine-4-hydroxylase
MRAVSNFYWVTAEFGLFGREGKEVYGAGILSSPAELKNVVFNNVQKVFLDSWRCDEVAFMESYITDGFQDKYYVIDDWSILKDILRYLWSKFI